MTWQALKDKAVDYVSKSVVPTMKRGQTGKTSQNTSIDSDASKAKEKKDLNIMQWSSLNERDELGGG